MSRRKLTCAERYQLGIEARQEWIAKNEPETLRKANARALQAAQHVYVIPAREYVKIGIAMDVRARWKAIRCGNPLLEPVCYTTTKLVAAHNVERLIHHALKNYRVRGTEWFRCNRYFAIEIVKLHETSGQPVQTLSRTSGNSGQTST